MGRNFGQRRQRNSDLRNPGDVTEYAIGVHDFKLSHYDEQVVSDVINEKLDVQEAKLKKQTEFFER